MQQRCAPSSALQVEPLGEAWVAYCARSGETLMLSNDSAAIIEVLRESAASADDVCRTLAAESGVNIDELQLRLSDAWAHLLDTGVIVPIAAT